MKVMVVYALILLGIFSSLLGKGNDLVYEIEITKDTIYIGEPIIVKCRLINNSDSAMKIFDYCGEALLSYGYSRFYLYSSNDEKEYEYGVFSHASLLRHSYFSLDPHDSVYFYTILCWDGNDGFTYFKYDRAKPGLYKLRSTYFKIESNVDSFYADTMPIEEKQIYKQAGPIIDEFWGFPYGTERETTKKILEIFPSIIKRKSILSPFCHYILWYKSFDDESKAESLVEEFFKKYPNSPLGEKLMFDLYRYYAWYKNDAEKGKAIIGEALKRYPDNLLGYKYLGIKSKKERPK